eukprot:TRINITY_DN43371_c0_g1_i1.p1 TRINITY_DN43371_c0_g1~~TRINITY_DN43371_c0_g1_i1.p1  ORF type:complete len:394 (+),score=69.20 TRINITY_DN43371_c0_g1_i1:79-1260(+)
MKLILTLSVAVAAISSTSASSVSISLERKVSRVAVNAATSTKSSHKMAYFGKVALGSSKQEFTAVFDTGSGNLIVPGTDCSAAACVTHQKFDLQKSSSTKSINCDGSPVLEDPDEITITFGTGKITGQCFTDSICIGSACSQGNFISSTDESDQPFSSFAFDGVLGLAPDTMAQSKEFSVMNMLSSSGALKNPVFSVFLSDSDAETSEITFGDVKQDHMGSDLFWVPIQGKSGYWEVQIDDIYFDKLPTKLCEGCRVAVDTGTSELAGPSDVIDNLRQKLGQGSRYCRGGQQTLPKLGFSVNGRLLSLSPKDYSSADCSLSLMSLDVPPPKGPLFVFGIPFLTKYYTVYDHEKLQVGFAVAKHNGEVPEMLLTVDSNEHRGDDRQKSFLSKRA